jgi:hypothetical protein
VKYSFEPHFSISAPQHLSISASQHLSISASQHLSISASQHLSISATDHADSLPPWLWGIWRDYEEPNWYDNILFPFFSRLYFSCPLTTNLSPTASLLTHLPSTYTYDYLDSPIPCAAAPELKAVYPGPYSCFFTHYTPSEMASAVEYVREVVDDDGPYDCVIGFSQVC